MKGRESTFDHEADVGVAGDGSTVEEAFAAAARAMFSIMVSLETVTAREEVAIECSAPDVELLLVSWLNTLLAEADIRGMVFSEFEVVVMEDRLEGRARGERFDRDRHEPGVEVKGATLTELRVVPGPMGWRAQTVVDV